MITVYILLIALVVILGMWAIISLGKKPIEKKPHEFNIDSKQFKTEFATELFPQKSHPQHEAEKELPWGYGDNKITVLVRDPSWLYVFWEINDTKRNEIKKFYGENIFYESQPILRVYDITNIAFNGNNANDHFDVWVNDYASNWYVRVDKPDCTFCIDIGRVLRDGSFIMLARSNYASTPRSSLSDRIDPEWMMIGELSGENPYGFGYGLSSPELFGITSISSEELVRKDE